MSAVDPVTASHLRIIEKLFESVNPSTHEEKKTTAAALKKMLENKRYLEDCPLRLQEPLNQIYKGLSEPLEFEENSRFQIIFLRALRNQVEQKIQELDASQKESCQVL